MGNRMTEAMEASELLITPAWKVKGLFYIMRAMQKKFGFNAADVAQGKARGWLEQARPWK